MKNNNLKMLFFFLLILIVGCDKKDKDENNDNNNTMAEREWDVDIECGESVNTEAWVGPMFLFVWVKNSKDSECNVSVKRSGADIGPPLGNGRIYHPGSGKIYTRVNLANEETLKILCSGPKDKRCKFDYGIEQRK